VKKLINRPEAVVEEMVEGFAAIHPGLRRLPGHTVLVRADADAAAVRDRRVALVSGGGSGHEPATPGTSAGGCSPRRSPATSSPRPAPTRSSRRSAPWPVRRARC
jgi:hypothetical protein